MKSFKLLSIYGLVTSLIIAGLFVPSQLSSANLTDVRDTLQTSRLSFHGRVDSTGTSVGSSNVRILTTAGNDSAGDEANSLTTAALKSGDSLIIGTGTYTVVGISSATEFTVTPVLLSGDADNTDPIYYRSRPRHVVTFETTTAVANGFFQILLPADAANDSNDGLPDDGYDFNTAVDVVASDVGVYDFVTGVATPAGGAGCTVPANYHCFSVHYSGTGSIGQAITITIGNTNGTNTPVAPAPGSGHVEGTASTYPVLVKNFAAEADPNSDIPVDSSGIRVAHIESVLVTATVEPTISFSIAGVSTATSTCGANPDINTATALNAPLAVPFGSLTLNTFTNASHELTVSTNAPSGYVVTAAENDQLSIGGLGVTTIPDTTCDSGPCTTSSNQNWATATNNGFGYSIDNIGAASVPFEYNDSGTFQARPFPILGSEQTIFSSTTVADAENIYICYRISVGATQPAGDYENQITYTATGTF